VSSDLRFRAGDSVRIRADFPGRHYVDADEAAGLAGVVADVDDREGFPYFVKYMHPTRGLMGLWFDGQDLELVEPPALDIPAAYAALKARATVIATTSSDVVTGTISELRVGLAGAEQVCVWTTRGVVWVDVDKVRLATAEEAAR